MVPKLSFEVLDAFGRFGREQKLSLRDPKSIDAFADSVHASLKTAIGSDAWLHGQRTQKMFEALLVSLGECALLKTEDSGLVHPQGKYIAPDFRVVLKDGTQWLIEVKNVYDADPAGSGSAARMAIFRSFRITHPLRDVLSRSHSIGRAGASGR